MEVVDLRRDSNFMEFRTWVLNLHGSLGWLHDGLGDYGKFKIDALRRFEYWSQLRSGETNWEPVAVLTDQKDDVAGRYGSRSPMTRFVQG